MGNQAFHSHLPLGSRPKILSGHHSLLHHQRTPRGETHSERSRSENQTCCFGTAKASKMPDVPQSRRGIDYQGIDSDLSLCALNFPISKATAIPTRTAMSHIRGHSRWWERSGTRSPARYAVAHGLTQTGTSSHSLKWLALHQATFGCCLKPHLTGAAKRPTTWPQGIPWSTRKSGE